jgi:hypothetical protein
MRLPPRDDRDVGIDAFGQIPESLVADPPRYGDFAATDHERQHLGDVAIVGPSGGPPWDRAGVRQFS